MEPSPKPKKVWSFKLTEHDYTEHPTYTGPGCAHCGLPEEMHTSSPRFDPKTRANAWDEDGDGKCDLCGKKYCDGHFGEGWQ